MSATGATKDQRYSDASGEENSTPIDLVENFPNLADILLVCLSSTFICNSWMVKIKLRIVGWSKIDFFLLIIR